MIKESRLHCDKAKRMPFLYKYCFFVLYNFFFFLLISIETVKILQYIFTGINFYSCCRINEVSFTDELHLYSN